MTTIAHIITTRNTPLGDLLTEVCCTVTASPPESSGPERVQGIQSTGTLNSPGLDASHTWRDRILSVVPDTDTIFAPSEVADALGLTEEDERHRLGSTVAELARKRAIVRVSRGLYRIAPGQDGTWRYRVMTTLMAEQKPMRSSAIAAALGATDRRRMGVVYRTIRKLWSEGRLHRVSEGVYEVTT